MRLKYQASISSLSWPPGSWRRSIRPKANTAHIFSGSEVVFEFDRRVYEKAIHSADSNAVDFADLDILQVTVTGNFNQHGRPTAG